MQQDCKEYSPAHNVNWTEQVVVRLRLLETPLNMKKTSRSSEKNQIDHVRSYTD